MANKIIFMLHQTIIHPISQRLQRASFLTFTESKQTELILHLKYLIEYHIPPASSAYFITKISRGWHLFYREVAS